MQRNCLWLFVFPPVFALTFDWWTIQFASRSLVPEDVSTRRDRVSLDPDLPGGLHQMNRRMFLKVSAAAPAAVAAAQLPRLASVARAQQKDFTPRPGTWRTFELTTRVEVLQPSGVARVWLPAPSVVSDYQQPIENSWVGNAKVT